MTWVDIPPPLVPNGVLPVACQRGSQPYEQRLWIVSPRTCILWATDRTTARLPHSNDTCLLPNWAEAADSVSLTKISLASLVSPRPTFELFCETRSCSMAITSSHSMAPDISWNHSVLEVTSPEILDSGRTVLSPFSLQYLR